MFNKLKTIMLVALTAAATLLGRGQAFAFTYTTNLSAGVPFGTCTLYYFFEDDFFFDDYDASIYVDAPNPMWAGECEWGATSATVPVGPTDNPANAADVALCGFTNISNFTSEGATDPTFADEAYMGIAFRANDPNTGVLTDYEFAISGVTNSQIVTNAIPVPANVAPTADAGLDQTVASATAPVTLDGTGSSDPEAGQTLTYAWTAPAGVTLSDATAASPTFTAPTLAAGDPDATLTFSLIVTDNLGLASTADTALAMVFRLMISAKKKWRKNSAPARLPELIQGVVFKDVIRQVQVAA